MVPMHAEQNERGLSMNRPPPNPSLERNWLCASAAWLPSREENSSPPRYYFGASAPSVSRYGAVLSHLIGFGEEFHESALADGKDEGQFMRVGRRPEVERIGQKVGALPR